MKTVLFAIVSLVSVNAAHADGFKCTADHDYLNVSVFNRTDPSDGTRNAAVMVLSDSSVQSGNKTIARFTDVNSTLSNEGAYYMANVDHRFNDSGRKGELLGGTKIGYLKTITLNVDFSYAYPVANGDEVPAMLKLIKRDGEVIKLEMTCARYLKN